MPPRAVSPGVSSSDISTLLPTLHVAKTWLKTSSPTVSDDTNAGYTAGDRWINTVQGQEWTAYSVSAGAADWRLLPLSSFTAPRITEMIAGLDNSIAQMGTLV